ncbi:MAG TPA: tetratricopeptide repeat protein [Gammaproteobacteria bacterium]|nr:tetratricopeptide repeat protein [Gammaproteobacteria bacterium]
MATASQHPFEALTVILSVAAIVAIGSLITTLPAWQAQGQGSRVKGYTIPAQVQNGAATAQAAPEKRGAEQAFREAFGEPQSELEARVMERFQQAVALLHAKRYDYAITALDAVLEMAPNMPEAYVNMGYAFLGLEEYGPARGAFEKAIDLKVDQVNAYYGLAEAFEGLKDYEAALGAMRSYIHLSKPDDPYLAKARAALWEWEAQLGRVKGVKVAPEGVPGATVKTPSWDTKH